MESLKRRILQEGIVCSEQVLKLDSLLNHQVDPVFIMEAGQAFASLFKDERLTKIVTIESSGISVAFATACELGVPLLFARRKKTLTTDEDVYCERVPSFTKGIVTDIMISKQFLGPDDRVAVIDDIIANGDAARGVLRIIEQSGASLAGLGVVVEKSFQAGARTLREQGIRVESLVKIRSLANGNIDLD